MSELWDSMMSLALCKRLFNLAMAEQTFPRPLSCRRLRVALPVHRCSHGSRGPPEHLSPHLNMDGDFVLRFVSTPTVASFR